MYVIFEVGVLLLIVMAFLKMSRRLVFSATAGIWSG